MKFGLGRPPMGEGKGVEVKTLEDSAKGSDTSYIHITEEKRK